MGIDESIGTYEGRKIIEVRELYSQGEVNALLGSNSGVDWRLMDFETHVLRQDSTTDIFNERGFIGVVVGDGPNKLAVHHEVQQTKYILGRLG